MSKRPDTTDLTTLSNAISSLNENFDNIEEAFDNTLSRDGSTPNYMEADFDLNSNNILNVGKIDVQSITIDGSPVSVDEITLRFKTPVAYSAGLEVTDSSFTVTYQGNTYYADPSEVPFTTTASFDSSKWVIVTDSTFVDLADMQANIVSRGDGVVHTTRKEGFSYVEDSSDPHVTFNGVGLQIQLKGGAVYLEQFGVDFDGSVDHSAIMAVAQAIPFAQKIVAPAGKTVRFDSTVTLYSDGPDWHFQGVTVDQTNNFGVGLETEGSLPTPYGQAATLYGGKWEGPNRASGSVGQHITGSTSTKAPHGIRFVGLSLEGFEHARKIGDNAYAVKWDECKFFNCDTLFYFPSGLTNSGERLLDISCTLFNSGNAVTIDGVCNYHGVGCSYDYCGQMFNLSGAGNIVLSACHFEYNAATITDTPVKVTDSGAVFSMSGGRLLAKNHGTWSTSVPNFIHCDGLAVFSGGVRMFGILPAESFDTGSGKTLLSNNSYLETSQVTGVRGDNCMVSPSFESGSIDDFMFLVGDTSTITDRYTGGNLELSVTNGVTPSSGTYCLRAAKRFGAGSDAAFSILVPCSEGEFFFSEIDILNNDSRTGSISIGYNFVKSLGSDSNGIPILVDVQSSSMSVSPTNTWDTYRATSYVKGGPPNRAPASATHFEVKILMNGWVGGQTGASEDGGIYSLYFDNIGIYRWS